MQPSQLSFVCVHGRRLAFRRTPGAGPGVVFLGGYRSDMEGAKATHLEAWCAAQGRAFLRFDYSGHGQSAGRFEDGCIGDWLKESLAVIAACTEGPQILVGSSMGGWIGLLLARDHPARVAGLVTIAAAPDFVIDIWHGLDAPARARLAQSGVHRVVLDDGGVDIFTERLFRDGPAHTVMDRPLALDMPVRMLQGMDDAVVSPDTACALLRHVAGPDISLELVKGKDHRFSDPACRALIARTLAGVVRNAGR